MAFSVDTFDQASYSTAAIEERLLVDQPDPYPTNIIRLRDKLMDTVFEVPAQEMLKVRAIIHYGAQFDAGQLVRDRVDQYLWDVKFREVRRVDKIDEMMRNHYGYIRPALDELSDDCLDPLYQDYLLRNFRKDTPIARVAVAASIPVIWADCTKDGDGGRNCLPMDDIFCNGQRPPLFESPLTGCVTAKQLMDHLENFVDEHDGNIPSLPDYPTLEKHLPGIVDAVDERGNPLSDSRKVQLVSLYTSQDCANITPKVIDWTIESTQLVWSGDDYLDDKDWAEDGLPIID